MVDAYLSGANSSPPGHSIQGNVRADMSNAHVTASTGSFELALTGGISSCRRQLGSNNLCRILLSRLLGDGYCGWFFIESIYQSVANARHSAYVFFLVSICQMIVASFRITATRAMLLPRRRLIRLYHSRNFLSFFRAW